MKKSVMKMTATLLVAAMAGGLLAGCAAGGTSTTTTAAAGDTTAAASGETSSDATTTADPAASTGVTISMLNTKGEIQTALEGLAEVFESETGIKLEVIAAGTGESPYTRITSMYNSGTAPTMAILDTTDVIALAGEYALDLSDSKWVAEVGESATKIDGKVYSFPFAVEGRGIIYNKKAIEDTLGKEFDPDSINSLDSFKAILEELRAAGMENPYVLSKEDWSLGAHHLGYVYDTYDGTTAGSEKLINSLKDGSVKMQDVQGFNDFVDTLDVILEYNVNKADPLGAIYEQDPIFLVDGESAFWGNGVWAWPNLADAGATVEDEYGFIPFVLGNDTESVANSGIQASPSKQLMVDKVQASAEQQAAAQTFIDWLVFEESGQKGLVLDCAIIPAAKNNPFEPVDPLGKDIVKKMADGKVYTSSFVAPGDAWSVCGAIVQKYVAGESTKEEMAESLNAYWTSQE